jgi:sortase A
VKHEGESSRDLASRSVPERSNSDAPAFALPPGRATGKRRDFGRALERALWAVAAACALYLAYVGGDRALWSLAANRQLERAQPAIADVSGAASVEPTSLPADGIEKPRPPFVARLEIPSVELTALVVDGVDDVTLRRAVGRIPSSARPGESGNVALAGHRDTDFRGLRHLKRGDLVELRTGDGKYAYEVEWIRIVGPDRVDVLKAGSYPTLTLVTCYPFHYIGRAPMRFVVRAREVSRPGVVLARS